MSADTGTDKRDETVVKKALTGIKGLDEITAGGLPRNRATLICGGPGCGKTLLSMEFIVNGIVQSAENGAYISFDESRQDLGENVASLGFDLDKMIEENTLSITDIPFHPQISGEIGAYDLSGLFAIIGHAIDSVKAKRVVIDGIDAVFSFFNNESLLRQEMKRLIVWLKEKKVTAVITCERGEGLRLISRHGIEEYVSDCVILLDQRVIEQISIRRLKIIKYRGALHGTNEYPFLVTKEGILIFPVTSMMLDHAVSNERISTGVKGLDAMLSNKGYFKGSSILISGTAGTGKSSIAAHFAAALGKAGKRCLYFAFEESADQIIRNMKSIGLDLATYVDNGLLQFHARRPTEYGVEMHLMVILDILEKFRPDGVVFDPISNLTDVAVTADIKSMFTRILNYLKKDQITTVSTNLLHDLAHSLGTDIGISSVMDTWIMMINREKDYRKERYIEIVKSRGMAHVDTLHKMRITENGFEFNQ